MLRSKKLYKHSLEFTPFLSRIHIYISYCPKWHIDKVKLSSVKLKMKSSFSSQQWFWFCRILVPWLEDNRVFKHNQWKYLIVSLCVLHKFGNLSLLLHHSESPKAMTLLYSSWILQGLHNIVCGSDVLSDWLLFQVHSTIDANVFTFFHHRNQSCQILIPKYKCWFHLPYIILVK